MKSKVRHLPCPYTGAAHCGKHVGYCDQCQRYGRLTPTDKRVVFMLLFFFLLSLVLMFCSSCSVIARPARTYCPTYSSFKYNHKIVMAKDYNR